MSEGQRSPRVDRAIAWRACLVQERPVGCSSVGAVVEVMQPWFCGNRKL
jgi:hypothetical protein